MTRRPDPRVLVRVRLDLFVSRGHAHRGRRRRRGSRCAGGRSCSGRSSRRRAGTPRRSTSFPARAATCGGTWSARRPGSGWPATGQPVSAEQPDRGPRRAFRGRQGLDAGFHQGGLHGRNSPRAGTSARLGDRGDPVGARSRPGRDPSEAQGDANKTRLKARMGEEARSAASSARPPSSPRTASCSGATTAWSRPSNGPPARAPSGRRPAVNIPRPGHSGPRETLGSSPAEVLVFGRELH